MRCRGALFGLLALGSASAQSVALFDGDVVTIQFPATPASQAVANTELFIDVGPEVRGLRFTLEEDRGSRDVDILLRRIPFTADADIGQLFAEAEYFSAGASASEFVEIQDSATPAVGGERWHLALLAFSGAATSAELTVSVRTGAPAPAEVIIDFDNRLGDSDCGISPWNDPEPFTPIGGNDATTLGQARRNALIEALDAISDGLFSPVPITVRACWEGIEDDDDDDNSVTLAFARPNFIAPNTPGVSEPDTWHAHAVVAREAGTVLCNVDSGVDCLEQDVFITFNVGVDEGDLGANRRWYYGFDGGLRDFNDIDFIYTAIHEISHGLGFVSFLGEDGSLLAGSSGTVFNDAFTAHLVDNREGLRRPLQDPTFTDAERAEVLISDTGLQWSGAEAAVNPLNNFASNDDGLVRMNAPDPYDPGSSVSHLNRFYCDVMNPTIRICGDGAFRSLSLTRPMLNDVGWAPGGDIPPYVGLWYDRAHDGHGFDLQLGGFDGVTGEPIYVLTFYSYETSGVPEWFQAVGRVRDGTFSGTRNAEGIGFPQFAYDATRSPPQQAEPRFGQVAVSFNEARITDGCRDGADRSGAAALGSFQFVTDRIVRAWCVEPLVDPGGRPAVDFGGLWFAGEVDTGWGFTLENILRPDGSIDLFVLLYVYAADGSPVWFFGFAPGVDLSAAVDLTLFQRTGYPRSQDFSALSDQAAGSFTLVLTDPLAGLDGSNRVSVDVTYQGVEGGDWVRSDVPIQRLSQPRD